MSRPRRLASSRKLGSFIVSMKLVCRAAAIGAGRPGGAMYGRPSELLGCQQQQQGIPLRCGLDVVQCVRDVRKLWMALQSELHDEPDALLGKHLCHCSLDAGPGDGAIALHLAAIHRQIDFARARIAGDYLESGAQNGIRDNGKCVGRASRPTQKELLLERLVKGFHRRVGARDQDLELAQCAADPGELARVETAGAGIQDCSRYDLRIDGADHGAILGCDRENVVGNLQRERSRNILRHKDRISRNVLGPMRCDRTREQVIAAAGARADQHAYLLAAKVLRDILRSGLERYERKGQGDHRRHDETRATADSGTQHGNFSRLHLISAKTQQACRSPLSNGRSRESPIIARMRLIWSTFIVRHPLAQHENPGEAWWAQRTAALSAWSSRPRKVRAPMMRWCTCYLRACGRIRSIAESSMAPWRSSRRSCRNTSAASPRSLR